MPYLSDWISIGITTRNRWQDLKITLSQISKFGLDALPIIVINDGSDSPCPYDPTKLIPSLQFIEYDESKGLIARRNEIAKTVKTQYYLSLDDDSFPVSGSLEKALEFAQAHQDLLCLSFPVYNPVLQEYQSASIKSETYPVRCFVGCGHLLHVPHFLALGGYTEELIHQGEEMDIAARGFQKGLYCYHFPELKIHHTASNIGRNWHRMDFYGARNNFLWNDWFIPEQLKLIKQIRTFVSRCIILTLKIRRPGQIKGVLAGFQSMTKYQHYRQPMSLEVYRRWQALPYT